MGTDLQSDQFVITAELAAELQGEVVASGHGKWTNVYFEIQDDGRGLYMSVDLPVETADDLLKTYKVELMQLLGPRLPARIGGRSSWTVGIRYDGRLVDSVDSLNFPYDAE